MSILYRSIDLISCGLARNVKNAKEAWVNLRNTDEQSGSTRKICLLRRLPGIRLIGAQCDEDVICQTTQHCVNELFTTNHQLAKAGFTVDDAWLASLLIQGLSKHCDSMILGLKSFCINHTVDIVKAKLLQDVKMSIEMKPAEDAYFSKSKLVPKANSD